MPGRYLVAISLKLRSLFYFKTSSDVLTVVSRLRWRSVSVGEAENSRYFAQSSDDPGLSVALAHEDGKLCEVSYDN